MTMSRKKGGGDFQNITAKKWRNTNKIPLMSQKEIFKLLNEDIDTILQQVTCARKGTRYNGKIIQHPDYIANGFANISTAFWFLSYVQAHVRVKKKSHCIHTDLTRDQVESLKSILADAYGKSLGGVYSSQVQDDARRNEYISKAFIRLMPNLYHLTGKLKGLSKSGRRELTIQIYGDPVFKFRYVHRKINESTVSDKKKLKFLKTAYGKRYIAMVGAAMTTEGNGSDCLAMVYDDLMSKKKKKRGPYIQAYAEAYKRNGPSRYFRMDRNFYDKNKKLIKLLISDKKHPKRAIDLGYVKAFEDMKRGKPPETRKNKENRLGKLDNRKDHKDRPPWKEDKKK